MAVIRTRKDGGCSICYAKDENVGKRRCCHILDNAAMNVRHERGVNFIDISGKVDDENASFSIKASEKTIKSYISSLSNGLSDKDKQSILEALKDV